MLPIPVFVHEKILKTRYEKHHKLQVLIRWQGLDDFFDTWEPIESVPRELCELYFSTGGSPPPPHLPVWDVISSHSGLDDASVGPSPAHPDETFVIEKILFALREKSTGKNFVYIKWDNYKMADSTWEPVENIQGVEKNRLNLDLFFEKSTMYLLPRRDSLDQDKILLSSDINPLPFEGCWEKEIGHNGDFSFCGEKKNRGGNLQEDGKSVDELMNSWHCRDVRRPSKESPTALLDPCHTMDLTGVTEAGEVTAHGEKDSLKETMQEKKRREASEEPVGESLGPSERRMEDVLKRIVGPALGVQDPCLDLIYSRLVKNCQEIETQVLSEPVLQNDQVVQHFQLLSSFRHLLESRPSHFSSNESLPYSKESALHDASLAYYPWSLSDSYSVEDEKDYRESTKLGNASMSQRQIHAVLSLLSLSQSEKDFHLEDIANQATASSMKAIRHLFESLQEDLRHQIVQQKQQRRVLLEYLKNLKTHDMKSPCPHPSFLELKTSPFSSLSFVQPIQHREKMIKHFMQSMEQPSTLKEVYLNGEVGRDLLLSRDQSDDLLESVGVEQRTKKGPHDEAESSTEYGPFIHTTSPFSSSSSSSPCYDPPPSHVRRPHESLPRHSLGASNDLWIRTHEDEPNEKTGIPMPLDDKSQKKNKNKRMTLAPTASRSFLPNAQDVCTVASHYPSIPRRHSTPAHADGQFFEAAESYGGGPSKGSATPPRQSKNRSHFVGPRVDGEENGNEKRKKKKDLTTEFYQGPCLSTRQQEDQHSYHSWGHNGSPKSCRSILSGKSKALMHKPKFAHHLLHRDALKTLPQGTNKTPCGHISPRHKDPRDSFASTIPSMNSSLNKGKKSSVRHDKSGTVSLGQLEYCVQFCRVAQNSVVQLLEPSGSARHASTLRCYCSHMETLLVSEEQKISESLAQLYPHILKSGISCTLCSFSDHWRCCLSWISLSESPNRSQEIDQLIRYYVCLSCRLQLLDPFFPVESVCSLAIVQPPTSTTNVEDTKTFKLSLTLADTTISKLQSGALQLQLRGCQLTPWTYRLSNYPHEVSLTLLKGPSAPVLTIKPPAPFKKRRETPHSFPTKTMQLMKRMTFQARCVYQERSTYSFAIVLCSTLHSKLILQDVKKCNWIPLHQCHQLYGEFLDPNHASTGEKKGVKTLTEQELADHEKEEDDIVVSLSDKTSISLHCPCTLMRIQLPGRGLFCKHLQCFDVTFYIQSQSRMGSHKNRWKCPICYQFCYPHEIILDSLFMTILNETSHTCRAVNLFYKNKTVTWSVIESSQNDEEEKTLLEMDDSLAAPVDLHKGLPTVLPSKPNNLDGPPFSCDPQPQVIDLD